MTIKCVCGQPNCDKELDMHIISNDRIVILIESHNEKGELIQKQFFMDANESIRLYRLLRNTLEKLLDDVQGG